MGFFRDEDVFRNVFLGMGIFRGGDFLEMLIFRDGDSFRDFLGMGIFLGMF